MSVSYDLGRITGGFVIMGYYATLGTLVSAITSPANGDAYGVGTAAPYKIYVWDGVTSAWLNNGTLKGERGAKWFAGVYDYDMFNNPKIAIGDYYLVTGYNNVTYKDKLDNVYVCTSPYLFGDATWDYVCNIRGDKGNTGDTGATGAAATITVGTVTTSAPGSNAVVANSGTSGVAVFDFTLPQGDASVAEAAAAAAELSASTAEGAATAAAESAATAATDAAEAALTSALGAVSTHNTDAESHTDIRDDIRTVEAIARGRATGYVFDTYADMVAWLAIPDNIAGLVTGDNLYIRDVGVKDYWWDGTAAQELEAECPDLPDYYTKTQVDALMPILITRTDYDALVAAGTVIADRTYDIIEGL